MPTSAHFSDLPASRLATTSLIGSSCRLALAASVLGTSRAFEAGCRAPSGVRPAAPCGRDGPFELAVQFYEDGDWRAAFAAAAAQADAGDPCAARLALLMLRHGAPLYGIAFTAHPCRVARWAKSVIQATAATNKAAARRDAALRCEPERPIAQRDPRSTSRRTASPSSITAIA